MAATNLPNQLSTERPPIRIVLADDAYLVRLALGHLFEGSDVMTVVGECEDASEVPPMLDQQRADVLITDIRMPPSEADEGIRLACRLRQSHPALGVIVLSTYADVDYALRLFEDGCDSRAYLLKDRIRDRTQVVEAVKAVANGGSVIDPKIVEDLLRRRATTGRSSLDELTQRELETLALVAEGQSNTAIAESLFLTKRAVEKHVNAIFAKLDLGDPDPRQPAGQGGAALPVRSHVLRAHIRSGESPTILPERRPRPQSSGSRGVTRRFLAMAGPPPGLRRRTATLKANRSPVRVLAHGDHAIGMTRADGTCKVPAPMVSVPRRDLLDVSARRSSRLLGVWRWEPLVAVVAVAAAAVAFWVTLRADFLAHPAWAAVQRADVILGPVAVGLYWHHRRPGNRLGLLLIALGLVTIPYILEGSTVPALFGIGVLWEVPISVMTLTTMLAFPNGRLEGLAERLILAAWVVGISIPSVVFALTVSRWAPGGSIVGCRTVCPPNGLAALPPPSWLSDLSTFSGYAIVVVDVAAAALLGWRFVRGTPPRRRAMAIGASLVMLFFLVQAAYHAMYLVAPGGLSPSAQPVSDALQWVLAGARSLIWYGFFFALVAAELFAGRALRGLVRDSMGRPPLRELERMVRGPLGDPGLRLGFWRPSKRDFAGADGEILAPRSGQALTEVERDGRPAVALAHDKQLAEDPELLQAAGAVALLAQENAELEGAWKASLRDLANSRTRLVTTADRERRKLERDLHDGAQQQLMAVQYNVRLAQDQLGDNGALAGQLETIGAAADQALDELRTLAHGIYPHVLRDLGLVAGLRWFARTVPKPVEITDRGIGRCGRGVEAAIYFCSTEAIQNAVKYAGDDAHVAVTLGRDREGVQFAIADDGVGMDPPAAGEGDGLTGMRDRIGAVGGTLEMISAPGSGTTVRGSVPLDDR